MNSKLFNVSIAICFFFITASIFASPSHGEYQCPITFNESVDISIEEGEHFPTFYGHLESPRERNEVLKLTLKGEKLKVNNPKVLPNWLLITEKYFNDQDSFDWINDDGTKTIQVDWNGTWYFGSTVSFTISHTEANSFITEVRFDDNDGWWQTLKNVTCTRL